MLAALKSTMVAEMRKCGNHEVDLLKADVKKLLEQASKEQISPNGGEEANCRALHFSSATRHREDLGSPAAVRAVKGVFSSSFRVMEASPPSHKSAALAKLSLDMSGACQGGWDKQCKHNQYGFAHRTAFDL
jgi:hypothetical protein